MVSLNPKTRPRHVGKEEREQQGIQRGSGGLNEEHKFDASLWLNLSEPQNPAKVLVPMAVAKRMSRFCIVPFKLTVMSLWHQP